MALELIQPRVDLAVIQSLATLTNTPKQQRLRVDIRIHTENIENDPRSRTVVPTTDDVSIADNEDELPLIIIVERRERVDRTTKRIFAFGIARDLAQNELVLQFGIALRAKLKGSKD